MGLMEIIFWSLLGLVFYTYLGYGMILGVLAQFFRKTPVLEPQSLEWPTLTVLIAAYNEAAFIEEKIRNTLALEYPEGKRQIWIVTDGSDDATPELVKQFEAVRLFHRPERKGKLAAVERVIPLIETELIVFTDANPTLNQQALVELVGHFQDPNVGVVAGEKRIQVEANSSGTEAGEGLYWKYESQLKTWDARVSSVLGAAGELFAVRTDCYVGVAPDTIVEDFVLSMEIVRRGKRGAYAPTAYAMESGSASIGEEWKRKVRIAAGGAQAIGRLRGLLNPFRHGILSWQYFSHRILRWTLAPLAFPFLLVSNAWLAWQNGAWYLGLMGMQVLLYGLALWEWRRQVQGQPKGLGYIPFYFGMMNAAIWAGWGRYLRGNQSVLWEKAKRKGELSEE